MSHAYTDLHSTARRGRHAPRRARGSRHEVTMLVAMCAVLFIALGLVIAFKTLPAQDFALGKFINDYMNPRDEKVLTLGEVKLGTTVEHVRDRHQGAVKGITRDGAITLAFLDGDDRYMVWYGEDGPRHIAYKARQIREITGLSEDDMVGAIAERYGAPSLATCSKRITNGMRDCQFSWWVPGNIRMDVTSRMMAKNGTPTLKVTTQITDTRTAGRLRRTAQRTEAAGYY